jgi:hypothetical protein
MGMKLGLHIREEHILKVSENRVLRMIFELLKEEVTGGWRKLHDRKIVLENYLAVALQELYRIF